MNTVARTDFRVVRACLYRVLFAGALAATTISATAAEADASDEEDVELETVVITGTRISSPNMTSTSPVLTVSDDDIRVGGRMDVTDFLNQLPQINSNSLGQDLGNRTPGLTSAGGVATADLRGLGPNRTLVLVDGRRLGTGSPQTVIQSPAPDLDQIPAALIQRVDVVTGGASAVYGSDAIAGVVNFILKRDFEGFQVDAQYGGNWHDNDNNNARRILDGTGFDFPSGSGWDGRTVNVNITAGANILEGRGNVTGFLGYLNMHPVDGSKRDYSACQMFYTAALDDMECGGSGNSNFFSPTNPLTNPGGQVFSVLGDQFIVRGTAETVPPAVFNTQPYIFMQRQNERFNAGFISSFEVNPAVRPYAELSFMNDRTHQEVAATALFRGSNVLSDTGNYLVNCSNPLLSEQQRALMCTPAEIAADTLAPGSVSADVDIGRRNVEGGPRQYEFEHTNYRFVLGSKGRISEGWNYDTYGQYYYTNFSNFNGADFAFDKITNALQVTTDEDGLPVCVSGGACVPYNIFQDGAVTEEALGYLNTPGTAAGNTELTTFHVDFTGDLGVMGLAFPSASEGIGVNIGYEYREEHVLYRPDAAFIAGLIVGLGGAYPALDAKQSVHEGFAEVRVPIVQGRPGIHDLVFDAGYRYSDYSTAGGVDTYKFELQYAPIPDLRFRASYNRAIRAPSISELFNPELVGKISFGEDPCAPSEEDGSLAATFEQCARTGVTQAQYDNRSIPQGTAGQLTQLQSGNPDLSPERGDTYTLGVTWRPQAFPQFTGSLDYYRIDMKDLISTLDATIIMSNCLDTGDPIYCSQLVRHPITGTLNGASVESGGYIVQSNVNIGAAKMEGIDVQAGYRFELGGLGGLTLALNGAYMLKNDTTPLPDGGSYDCTGLFGATCQTVNPEWRHSLRGTWAFPQNFAVTLTWRYMSRVNMDNNDSNPLLQNSVLGAPAIFRASIPAYNYVDLSGAWDVTDKLQLRAGINNVLDRDPPLAPTEVIGGGSPNTYEFYDGLGRQVFLALTARF